MSERLDALNAEMGWKFDESEMQQIESDAQRSARVLCADLPRPSLVNQRIVNALSLELISKHLGRTQAERLVKRQVLDMDRRDPLDPWTIGAKFLVLYSGAPQFVHQLDFIQDWEQVLARYASDPDGTGWNKGHHCDVNVCPGCTGGLSHLSAYHYKRGQWVTLHRSCKSCYDWLRYGTGKANPKRLAKLAAYIDPLAGPPNLKLV